MDKNYYDILQVNQNASPEIIEKAYKILAKKYHPDLQEEKNRKQAEEILKEINEAYEVLSNPEKKKEYNLFLENQKQQNESLNSKVERTDSSIRNNPSNSTSVSKEELLLKQQELLRQQKLQQLQREKELAYQEQLQQARQKAYYDAYIQDLKNRGYKIRYKKTFKDYIRILVTIIVVAAVLYVLWQLPFVQNYFMNLFQQNELLQKLVINK